MTYELNLTKEEAHVVAVAVIRAIKGSVPIAKADDVPNLLHKVNDLVMQIAEPCA